MRHALASAAVTAGLEPGPPPPAAKPEQAENRKDERDEAVTDAIGRPHGGVGEGGRVGDAPGAHREHADEFERAGEDGDPARGRAAARQRDRGDDVDQAGQGRQHVGNRGVAELRRDLHHGPRGGGKREERVDGDQQPSRTCPGRVRLRHGWPARSDAAGPSGWPRRARPRRRPQGPTVIARPAPRTPPPTGRPGSRTGIRSAWPGRPDAGRRRVLATTRPTSTSSRISRTPRAASRGTFMRWFKTVISSAYPASARPTTMIVVGTAPFMGDMLLRSVVTRLRGPAAAAGKFRVRAVQRRR